MICNAIFANLKSNRLRNFYAIGYQRPSSISNRRNPYDVLGLKTTCSTKEIKKAYIRLCKELHPDMKPGDTSQHKKFIELNAAYTTLLNSNNTKQNISSEDDFSHITPQPKAYWEYEKSWYEKEEYWQYHQYKKKQTNKKHTEINKLILIGCFILIIIGITLHYTAYRYATNYRIQKVDEKSKKISENYHNTRKSALDKGSIQQLSSLKKKWSNN